MARRVKHTTSWRLSKEDRERLCSLVAAVPPDADEHDPAFLRVLDGWASCQPPWNHKPAVEAYCCRDGTWLIDSVASVLEGITQHVGEP